MKSLIVMLATTTALTAPSIAAARQVTFTARIRSYIGPPAYLAFYVTDSKGNYVGSLWMAGTRTRYYHHLTDWYRDTGGDLSQISGLTGASVGPGGAVRFRLDLNDKVFDAGYVLHIDGAIENYYSSPNDLSVPLTTQNAGKTEHGRNLVASFTYSM